ncbi:metallophosphoesterase [Collimonas humicola]|uniref:metallophosphoesterase n=1 Tax=Collimonas humicola TaxID=2825886 RepID=UPI001B8C7002|nr:metallophosphoesterase [Collimonas humicola]
MLLLHISDIHFRAPDCLNPALDPERPYRTRMLQDVRARAGKLGAVGAILVGGDIAFKGDPREYEVAFAWLKELAEASGCPLERVFVIPGNHDVDRGVAIKTPAVRNVQAAIAKASPQRRERELRAQFSDSDTGRALLAPLAAYNDFAKLFSCQIYPPEHLYWKQDLPLEHGVHLRIYGLTSTLLSGIDGQDDTRESLYLSPLQTVLDPVDDVINLVMCHHPPDWFLDQDEVDDAICGRAAIHLFGHKHRQRITRDDSYVRFSAGAVNPDRHEAGWNPGYNLIDLRVVGNGRERKLEINAHLMQWQSNPDQFRPVVTPQGDAVFHKSILIPGQVIPVVLTPPIQTITPETVPIVDANTDVEAAMSNEITRNLVFRFWNLTVSQRREITLHLGLITGDELQLPESERYGRALLRAGERDLLDQLAHEITKREK